MSLLMDMERAIDVAVMSQPMMSRGNLEIHMARKTLSDLQKEIESTIPLYPHYPAGGIQRKLAVCDYCGATLGYQQPRCQVCGADGPMSKMVSNATFESIPIIVDLCQDEGFRVVAK